MSYQWRVATQDDFHKIYALIYDSSERNKWDAEQIRRRVIIPLFLDQLIVFHNDDEKLCGFLTIGFMDGQSADHIATIGVLPADWRSGTQFWVIDFLAPYGDGDKLLRKITSDLKGIIDQKIRFFRIKYKEIRGVEV